ncbi:MAG: hypothetical protein CL526_05390 [Aequorivita sp.]|nr:hypothetical protein [Aequorivita sp.]
MNFIISAKAEISLLIFINFKFLHLKKFQITSTKFQIKFRNQFLKKFRIVIYFFGIWILQ